MQPGGVPDHRGESFFRPCFPEINCRLNHQHRCRFNVDEIPNDVVQNLLNAQAILQRNPKEGIEWLKKSYGVDEKQPLPAEEDIYVDPDVRKLKEEIRQLRDQGEQQLRNADNERQRAMFAEISQFKDKVDEKGDLLHPHFQTVQGVMSGLLQSGRASDLESAYEQAVWSVP